LLPESSELSVPPVRKAGFGNLLTRLYWSGAILNCDLSASSTHCWGTKSNTLGTHPTSLGELISWSAHHEPIVEMLQFIHLGIRTREPQRLGHTIGSKIDLRRFAIPATWRRAVHRSGVGPTPKEIVIQTGEIHHGSVVWYGLLELLQDSAALKGERAVGVRAHHALDPEKRREPHSARHRRDVMAAASGAKKCRFATAPSCPRFSTIWITPAIASEPKPADAQSARMSMRSIASEGMIEGSMEQTLLRGWQ
jgi:hypothetical protein